MLKPMLKDTSPKILQRCKELKTNNDVGQKYLKQYFVQAMQLLLAPCQGVNKLQILFAVFFLELPRSGML